MHHIQSHIISHLSFSKWARFSEMRPKDTDTNVYSYHLKRLIKEGLIEKRQGEGYRLSPAGLQYADKLSHSTNSTRVQPKLMTMIIIKNQDGKYFLRQFRKQPFIESWTLMGGKLHLEDESTLAAVAREFKEYTLKDPPNIPEFVSSYYIRAFINGVLISSIVTYVYTLEADKFHRPKGDGAWFEAEELLNSELKFAPGIDRIMQDYIEGTSPGPLVNLEIDW